MISPLFTLNIGGKEYLIDGSFRMIRDISMAFEQDAVLVQSRVMGMRIDELCKLASVMLKSSGHDLDELTIGQWVMDKVGVTSPQYLTLASKLSCILITSMTTEEMRGEKKKEMEELLIQIEEAAKSVSPGKNTKSSASESSAGLPKRSGKATSKK
jgi:hypothetical protein